MASGDAIKGFIIKIFWVLVLILMFLMGLRLVSGCTGGIYEEAFLVSIKSTFKASTLKFTFSKNFLNSP